jgi:LacI family transcriptional regulator
MAAEHLLSLGHRRIAFWALGAGPNTRARRQGYDDAMRSAGIAVDPALLHVQETVEVKGRPENAAALARAHAAVVTGIVAYNDALAAGILQAAIAAGIPVPGDLSLVGVDDLPWVSLLSPPLTTIRLPLREMGEAAAELLLQAVEAAQSADTGGREARGAAPASRILDVSLEVRGSTGLPHARRTPGKPKE